MEILEKVNSMVWGVPTLALILGLGLYLCAVTKGVQFRRLFPAIKLFVSKLTSDQDDTGVSSYRALCTALAATVGTGNLAGVAGAIAIGGPGAVFWMWMCGFLGMGIKFAEAVLAVRYRVKMADGEYAGGPMYMICGGMKRGHFLAYIYCFFGVVAAFGVGNATQINTVVQGVQTTVKSWGVEMPEWGNLLLGICLAGITVLLFSGGASRIGKIAEILVPVAAVGYVLLCVAVLALRLDNIPAAFSSIFVGALSPRAATGGMLGSILTTIRIGVSRGVFTNEAGMGTASIAHGSANVKYPWEQGYMGIVEVFLDTIVICTMTALVILCAGVPIPYGSDPGVKLTMDAFQGVLGGWVQLPITLFLSLFAFATVLGWGLYGGRCAQFLFGPNAWKKFILLQGITVAISANMKCSTVWTMSEIVNGCMAIPNLLALAVLSGQVGLIAKKCPASLCEPGLPDE